METRRDVYKAIYREVRILRQGWHELFNEGSIEEIHSRMYDDARHPSKALSYVIDGIQGEAYHSIDAAIETALENGTLDPDDQSDAVFDALFSAARLLAVRMFMLGQHLAQQLPYDKLTPCPCSILTDEELNSLLQTPFDLEGKGWVIKNFKSGKGSE